MLSWSLLLVAASPEVPNVTLGPDAIEHAVPVEAPIARVTVFADRARVVRRAEVTFPRGVTTLSLPDVVGAAFPEGSAPPSVAFQIP